MSSLVPPAPANSGNSGSSGPGENPGVVKPDGGSTKSSKSEPSLTWEEQDALAKDVNEVFRVGNNIVFAWLVVPSASRGGSRRQNVKWRSRGSGEGGGERRGHRDVSLLSCFERGPVKR